MRHLLIENIRDFQQHKQHLCNFYHSINFYSINYRANQLKIQK
jgi:hypothetical protein